MSLFEKPCVIMPQAAAQAELGVTVATTIPGLIYIQYIYIILYVCWYRITMMWYSFGDMVHRVSSYVIISYNMYINVIMFYLFDDFDDCSFWAASTVPLVGCSGISGGDQIPNPQNGWAAVADGDDLGFQIFQSWCCKIVQDRDQCRLM